MGREKKRAWYTMFAHTQFPQDFWEFGNFLKYAPLPQGVPNSAQEPGNEAKAPAASPKCHMKQLSIVQ